jgi:hypothetical protein
MGRINLVAEKGDNIESLKKWANGAFTENEINHLYSKLNGNKINLTDPYVDIGGFFTGFVADSDEQLCNFNCFSSVISALSKESTKDANTWAGASHKEFLTFMSENGFSEFSLTEESIKRRSTFQNYIWLY